MFSGVLSEGTLPGGFPFRGRRRFCEVPHQQQHSMFSGVLSEGTLPGGFPFRGRRRFCEVPHPQQYSIATRDTVVPMNIEVPTKYSLSHKDRIVVLEIRLHSESPMLYRPVLHGNWSALSLARRALEEKFPTPTNPLTAVLPNRQVFLPNPVPCQVTQVCQNAVVGNII